MQTADSGPTTSFVMYCHQYKIGYFLVLNIYKNKLYEHTSKCSDFQKKIIDTITTSNLYLKFKENNENDMAVQVFRSVFYPS